jgi:hypothetical protein
MLEGVSHETCCLVLEVALASSTTVAAQVLTSQYDNLRTRATLREKILTPQNVNANQFGKQGAYKVDGAVYAQPLFIPSVEIPGKGKHDVIFVATEHDSVCVGCGTSWRCAIVASALAGQEARR